MVDPVRFSDPFKRLTNVQWAFSKYGYLVISCGVQPSVASDPCPDFGWGNNNVGISMDEMWMKRNTDWDQPEGETVDNFDSPNTPSNDAAFPIVQGELASTITSKMHEHYFYWHYLQYRVQSQANFTAFFQSLTVWNLDLMFDHGPNGQIPFIVMGGGFIFSPYTNIFISALTVGYLPKTKNRVPTPKTGVDPNDAPSISTPEFGIGNIRQIVFTTANHEFNIVCERDNPAGFELVRLPA